MRNSDSRSGYEAGSGVASSKSLPIPQSRVGRDQYNSSDAQNFSLPILTPDSESHSRNGSRTGSRSRIFGIGSENRDLLSQHVYVLPQLLQKPLPILTPDPDPDFFVESHSRFCQKIGSDPKMKFRTLLNISIFCFFQANSDFIY